MTVSTDYWKACSLCLENLDGDTNGLVSLSKRCHHLFHDMCIRRVLTRENNNNGSIHCCPNCRLPNFSEQELVPNPEYSNQRKKWSENQEGYTFEKAYEEEYGKPYSLEDAGFPAEHILRPRELRGSSRREEMRSAECRKILDEVNSKLRLEKDTTSPRRLEELEREFWLAHNLLIGALKKQDIAQWAQLEEIAEQQATNGAHIAANGARLTHLKILSEYYKKPESYYKKLSSTSIAARVEMQWQPDLSRAVQEMNNFLEKFCRDCITNDKTIEESVGLFGEMDIKLEEYINSLLPEAIKTVLNSPLLPDVPIAELPVDDPAPIEEAPIVPVQQSVFSKRNMRIGLLSACTLIGLAILAKRDPDKFKAILYRFFDEKTIKKITFSMLENKKALAFRPG